MDILRCPECRGSLVLRDNKIKCQGCGQFYDIKDGIPVLRKTFNESKEKTGLEYWNEIWSDEKVLREHEKVRKKSQIYFRISGIFRHIPRKKLMKGKILEAGCGGSLFMDILHAMIKPSEFWGLDVSLPACKITKKLHPFAKIVCGDILKPPFQSSSFDFVYSIGLIHHFFNPVEALEKHLQLVKPGGVIFCAAPNLSGLPGKVLEYFSYSKTMCRVKLSEMEACLIDNGFRIIGSGGTGGLQPFLMLESYGSLDEANITYLIFRNIISPLATMLNTPLLFLFNSPHLSPFIYVCGEKISNY